MLQSKNLIGLTFGKLTVISLMPGKGRKHWYCKCSCSNFKSITSFSLTSGATRSCGCLRKEKAKQQGYLNRTHGRKKHPLYSTWHHMHMRCYNKANRSYKDYGARGITICKRWHNIENFINDMGERPKNQSIDRIDNNGNYCPENCKWSTHREQAQNKRSTRYIEEICCAEWARIHGFNRHTVNWRIVNGWTIEEIKNTPVGELRK